MKNTKKSLFFSITALILCCALLAGTTLAWFTDSVTSGVNTITAGNLDIEVKYSKDGSNWTDLAGTQSLFSNNLWEPGHTEVVYLRVKNAGSLALKYKVLVSPVSENGGINVHNQNFKLSDYLVFGTTAPGAAQTYTRDTARAAVAVNSRGLNVSSLTRENTIEARGAEQYLALVVYMPEEVGNEANYKTGTAAPTINLGINVIATQVENESDSFDPNYDADADMDSFYAGAGAYYDYFEAVNVTATAGDDGKFTVTKQDNRSGVIASASGRAAAGANVNLLVMKSSDAEKNFTITVDDGHELNGYEIKVTGQEAGSLVQGKLYVGTGLENFTFYHNGQAMEVGTQDNLTNDQYFYNPDDGFVYFATTTFSPFQATYKAPAAAIGTAVYGTLADALAAAQNGETVILLKDVVATLPQSHGYANEPVFEVTKSISIDGRWFTVKADADNWALYNNGETGLIFSIGSQNDSTYTASCTVTMKNLTIEGHSMMKHGISVVKSSSADTTLNLENVTIKNCGANAISVNGTTVTTTDVTTSGCAWGGINVAKGGNLTVNSGDYDVVYIDNGDTATITINDGTFTVDPNNYVAEGKCAIQNSAGRYVIVECTSVTTEEELTAAVADANTEYVYLASDITLTEALEIKHSITLVSKNHSLINGQDMTRVINVNENTEHIDLTLKNLNIVGPTSGTYTRGVSAYKNSGGLTLTVDNCSVSANYYALNIAGANENVEVIVKNSTIPGWCAFQTWSAGTKATFENCTLIGNNDKGYDADGWNNFATVVINENTTNTELTFKNCHIEANQTTGNKQYLLSVRASGAQVTLENCTFFANDSAILDDVLGSYLNIYPQAADLVLIIDGETISIS